MSSARMARPTGRLFGLFAFLLLMVGVVTSGKSYAGVNCTIQAGVLMNPQAVNINPNQPNGTVLWSGKFTSADISPKSATCTQWNYPTDNPQLKSYLTGDGDYFWGDVGMVGATAYTGLYQTYQTSIPGVGLRISQSGADLCITGTWPLTCGLSYGGTVNNILVTTLTVTLELVKIGPITQGGTLDGVFGYFDILPWDNSGPAHWAAFRWNGSFTVALNKPQCSVTTPSLTVPLPTAPATAFSGAGTNAAGVPAQSFNIGLTCTGGDAGTSTNVYVTLTDATNPSNTTDMLSPTAATAGTGVGVRIFNGSTPVKFGVDSNVVGNANQWFVQTVNPGTTTVSIPLTANYVQVGPTVKGGPVAAIATFTMAYQ